MFHEEDDPSTPCPPLLLLLPPGVKITAMYARVPILPSPLQSSFVAAKERRRPCPCRMSIGSRIISALLYRAYDLVGVRHPGKEPRSSRVPIRAMQRVMKRGTSLPSRTISLMRGSSVLFSFSFYPSASSTLRYNFRVAKKGMRTQLAKNRGIIVEESRRKLDQEMTNLMLFGSRR